MKLEGLFEYSEQLDEGPGHLLLNQGLNQGVSHTFTRLEGNSNIIQSVCRSSVHVGFILKYDRKLIKYVKWARLCWHAQHSYILSANFP